MRVRMGEPEQPRRSRDLCLLSLDGGGVRGLSSLYILKHLMDTISPESPPKPCNYFDMIGGTSTGGLIAIMLGRLEMSVDECIEVYREISPKIFTKLHHRIDLRGKVHGRFDHKAIEDAVKGVLRSKGLTDDTLFRDSLGISSCKTFVCATSKQTGKTVVLSSYLSKRRGRGLLDVAKIWEAARATSAATSFFEPIRIADEDFVDGATPANNPIMELWTEAYDCFGNDDNSWDLEENVACVVSIGTGIPMLRPFGDDAVKIGAKLVKIATDTETRAEDFARHHPRLSSEEQYYRFNVSRGLESVGLEEASKLDEIVSATRHYLQTDSIHRAVTKCAGSLGLRQELVSNYNTASKHASSDEIQAYLENTKTLAKLFDISPAADVLAWFTNTKNFRRWVQSDGGYLYYPTSTKTANGHGRYLIGALPAAWKLYPPGGAAKPVKTAFADCCKIPGLEITGLLLRIISQVMVLSFSRVDWLQTVAQATTIERRLLAQPLDSASVGTLYNILSFILASARVTGGFSVLLVLCNIHGLRGPSAVAEIAQLRVEMERMGVHVLVTGKPILTSTMEDWGAQAVAQVDEDTEYLECLEALKFDDLYTRRNQVATALTGTNEWYREHPSFLAWKEQQSGLFWIQGKPGAGKSVLAKSILTEETASRTDKPIVASWFYSKRGGSIGMSHDSMMRSLAYQLLEQCQLFFSSFSGPFRRNGLVQETFADFLTAAGSRDDCPRIVCVLDGLDESESRDEGKGRDILDLFAELTEQPGSRLKVIILSRPYKTIQSAYGTYDILLEAENSNDIRKIIDQGVNSLARFMLNREAAPISSFARRRRLLLEGDHQDCCQAIPDPVLTQKQQTEEVDAIRTYLVDNARGVTLWVTLSIGQINKYARKGPATWTVLRKLLTNLPLELDEMYRAITQELTQECTFEHIKLARRILAWVITASTLRPLLVKELLDAMSIPDPSDLPELLRTSLREDPIQRNRPIFISWPDLCRSISDICGPLVEFVNPSEGGAFQYNRLNRVSGNSVVQLVHQTTKEFLEGFQDNDFGFRPGEAFAIVKAQSELYLELALPVHSAPYTPYLDDVSDDWRTTVSDTVHYFENKHLIPFVLTYFAPHEELLALVASSDTESWWLAPLFQKMFYRDLGVSSVVEDTVVGRCFSLSCNLGLQTAVDALLYLTSLSPGWWEVHREVVLGAAVLSAKCFGLLSIAQPLGNNTRTLGKPALQLLHLNGRPESLIRALEFGASARGHYRLRYGSYGAGSRLASLETASSLPKSNDKREAQEAIFRILHYLLGNAHPLFSTKEVEEELRFLSKANLARQTFRSAFYSVAESERLNISLAEGWSLDDFDNDEDDDDSEWASDENSFDGEFAVGPETELELGTHS